ncbi:DNA replication factor Cdt1 [Spodoptera frugiperda]|uniref:DNA replication factor Cdt1 n=1 Tax=Spodoptera frugiperda TaxID=7108 RepID=A0A9R0D985_SPOFR|nr:DNA replication factor Cdt1 [Spodoptera frugiperda]
MSQTAITSFFQSRKRPASEDLVTSKSKIPHVDRTLPSGKALSETKCEIIAKDSHQLTKSSAIKNEEPKQSAIQHASSKEQTKQESTAPKAFSKKVNASNTPKTTQASKIETTVSSRQELSLGDIRKKLAGSSRLAELRATADRLSKGIKELQQASEKRNLREFKSIDVEVPVSPSKKAQLQQNELLSPKKCMPAPAVPQRPLISPRKVVVSPIKSPSKVPAYIRHAALASTSSSLPLPHHYRFLAELFRGMETVVALLYNRNEKITFAKLRPSVQEMLKRSFTQKHLAQIKHLVPDFYNYEIQKVKNFSASAQKEQYELLISPNFPNDIKIMNPTVLLERRRYFYDILLQLVKKHHAQYLQTLDPPMVIPDDKLTRWHPEFDIEKIPEVESAKLPEMPNVEKFSNAQDVLAKARELFKCNTKMERALEKLAQAKARGLTQQEMAATGITDSKPSISINGMASTSTQTSQPSTSAVTIVNPALRNLPTSLLEKVKAKQAAKALEAMTRSSENDKKYLVYSRLPDLARTLRNIFVTERKNVLALNIILSKLDSSFKANIPASDLQKDIKVLTEELPDFVKLHEIRNSTYLKLDKNADLQKNLSKLEALAAKYRNE